MTIAFTPRQQEAIALMRGPASNVLARGGARSGKTYLLCAAVGSRALVAPGSRHLVIRKNQVDAKGAIGGDTMPKVIEAAEWAGIRYLKNDGVFLFPDDAEIWLGGLDSHNIEKILGREYATIWENEASEIPFAIHEQLRTRRAQAVKRRDTGQLLRLRTFVDLNPPTRAHWTYRLWFDHVHPDTEQPVDPADYAEFQMNPMDNVENLPPGFLDDLRSMSERMKRRFYEGEYLADLEEAIWRRGMIRRTQRKDITLDRIVVAVDPAISTEVGSDETGIVACGHERTKDSTGFGYVLADESGRFRPEEWARQALALWRDMDADCIVAEANQGGQMVETTIRAYEAEFRVEGRPPPRVKLVKATKGKAIRAEPIAGLYERNRVFHVGEFPVLEDEMCSFTVDYDRKAAGYSPDRMDALVWGMTELFGEMTKRAPRKVHEPPKPALPPVVGNWLGS